MAKLKAGRVATWVTERAIQILGGYGYTRNIQLSDGIETQNNTTFLKGQSKFNNWLLVGPSRGCVLNNRLPAVSLSAVPSRRGLRLT